jgi:hypothetical protein
MRIKWKNKRDGYLVPDDDVAKDGEHVRVPMMLFDAATGARRPGYATLSDQQLADRNLTAEEIAEFKANEREEFKRQLTERWRNNLMHL